MKRIFTIFTVLVFSVLLVACGDIELDAPVVEINNGIVSWEAVENADNYKVFINTDVKETTETSYNLNDENLAVGTYTIYVVAAAESSLSMPSNSVSFEVTDGGENNDLSTPSNVVITDDMITWDAVADATGYTVMIGTESYTTSTNSYDLSSLGLSPGEYSVTVKANNATDSSSASSAVSYVVTETTLSLDAPANLAISEDVLTWDAVTDALGYIVYVNGNEYPVTTNSFDLSSLFLSVDDYVIEVSATAGSVISFQSAEITYEVVALGNSDDVYAGVLLVINPSYLPDMDEEDFEDTYDYNAYMETSMIVEYYADMTVQSAMSTEDAIGFFDDMYTPMMNGEMNSVADLMEAFDNFDTYHMSNERIVDMLYGLVELALDLNLDDFEAELLDAQTMLLDSQENLTTYMSSTAYTSIVDDMLLTYAVTSEETEAIHMMLNSDMSFNLTKAFVTMGNDAYYGMLMDYTNYMYLISDGSETYLEQLSHIVIAMNADVDDREFLMDASVLFSIQSQIYYFNMMIESHQSYVMNIEGTLGKIEDIQTLINVNNDENKEALLSMVDFLMTVQATMPDEVIELLDDMLDGTTLTTTEVFQIKNELVDVIQEAMPTVDEFVAMRLVEIAFAGAISGMDLTALEAQATFLGNVDYASLEVSLLFIEDFSALDYAELLLILEPIMSDGMIDDPEVVVDFLSYIMSYFEDFEAAHPDEVQALADLLGSNNVEAIYNLLFEQVIAIVEEQENVSDEVIYMLNALANQYDEVVILLNMVEDIGIDMISTFVETEGLLVDALMALEDVDPEDQAAKIAALVDVIEGVDDYLQVFIDDLSEEQYVALLSFVSIPVSIGLANQLDMTYDEAEALMLNIYPIFGETGYAFTQVVLLFVQDIDEDAVTDMLNLLEAIDGDSVNPYEPLVNFILYLEQYVSDFEAAHPDEVAQLLALLDSDDLETIYNLVFAELIAYVENMDDYMMKEATLYVLNELASDYDSLISLRDLVLSIGMDTIESFVDSEGDLLNLIGELTKLGPDQDEELFILFTDIISELVVYHDNVVGLLDESQLNDLLDFVKIAVVVSASYDNYEIGFDNLDALAETLKPFVVSIMLDVLDLEAQVVATIDALDYTMYYGDTGYTGDPELALMLMGIDTVDSLMTMSNSLKIYSIFDTVFGDILENDDLQVITGMDSIDIEYMQDDIEVMFGNFVTDLSELADMDFENLSEDDIADIRDFMMTYGLIEESFEDSLMNATVIEEGDIIYIEVTDEYLYYQFTAPSNGYYRILSSGETDPALTVFDADFEFLDFADDEGEGYNFYIGYDLLEGETLYFQVEQYMSGEFGFTVQLSLH
jgi:hypothetical protein